jgi:putative Holliday junction resolvase
LIRILGLDYGKRRIGVALSDPLGVTAQPFETWNVRDWKSIILKISTLIKQMNVEKVVVGLPLSLSGEKSSMTKEVERFATKLYNYIQIPVILIDERLTSVQSEHILRKMNIKYSKKKHKVDLLAAVLILQNYLNQQTGSAIRHVRDIS